MERVTYILLLFTVYSCRLALLHMRLNSKVQLGILNFLKFHSTGINYID